MVLASIKLYVGMDWGGHIYFFFISANKVDNIDFQMFNSHFNPEINPLGHDMCTVVTY